MSFTCGVTVTSFSCKILPCPFEDLISSRMGYDGGVQKETMTIYVYIYTYFQHGYRYIIIIVYTAVYSCIHIILYLTYVLYHI